mmetsp:Transcript_94373/g.197165  ORF Transcript_94373/g.197165 Transcript_94373/m.197165 type:complete len:287 (-) Transcript_94373:125-985(-)
MARGHASCGCIRQPVLARGHGWLHFFLPYLHLRAQEAASNTAGREERQHRQVARGLGLLTVAVHTVDAVELIGRRQEHPAQSKQEERVHDVDPDVRDDVSAEGSSVGVHISCVHQREEQGDGANSGVIVVATQHPERRQQVDVSDGLQLDVPVLGPKHPEGRKEHDHRCDVGEEDGRERPGPQECRRRSVVAELFGGLRECHGPNHDHADADVHRDPNVLPQTQSAMESQDGSDRREGEGIHDEILECGDVRGEAGSTLSNQIDDGHQRLAITASGERGDHGRFRI